MLQKKAPPLIAILVCYYPKYFEQCLGKLNKLLESFEQEFKVIIVNNNSEALELKHKDIDIVEGSNDHWEFSGWDEGLNFAKSNYLEVNQSTIVFLNDTFYTHRIFTCWDFYFFKKSFNKVMAKKCDFSGELNSFGQSFSFNNMKTKNWISTYLFAIRAEKLKSIGKLCKFDLSKNNLYVDSSQKTIEIEGCSTNLARHLEKWFFPKNPKLGWYKNLTPQLNHDALLKKKITAVLNEKLLSIYSAEANLILDDVYGGKLAKLYLLGRKFIYKFIISSVKF